MNKQADPEELIRQVRDLPLEDREHVVAELTRDLDDHFSEEPAVLDELKRRAARALADPGACIPADQFLAELRELAASRKR